MHQYLNKGTYYLHLLLKRILKQHVLTIDVESTFFCVYVSSNSFINFNLRIPHSRHLGTQEKIIHKLDRLDHWGKATGK